MFFIVYADQTTETAVCKVLLRKVVEAQDLVVVKYHFLVQSDIGFEQKLFILRWSS